MPEAAADKAVPLPFTMPVTVVVNVMAGVVVGVATVPANPLALTTEVDVTVPALVPGGTAKLPSALKNCVVLLVTPGTRPLVVPNVLSMAVACAPEISMGAAVEAVLLALNVFVVIVFNMALVTLAVPMVVALPTLVTSPVKFALVVTVAALPVVF